MRRMSLSGDQEGRALCSVKGDRKRTMASDELIIPPWPYARLFRPRHCRHP